MKFTNNVFPMIKVSLLLKMKRFYDIEITDDKNGKNLVELDTYSKLSNHLSKICCCRSFTNQEYISLL